MRIGIETFVAASLPFIVSARIGNGGDAKSDIEKKSLVSAFDVEPGQNIDEDRYLAIFKRAWPECVRQHLTAIECKAKVDEDIMTVNTGVHTTIRSVIIYKRDQQDDWYNSVAIQMDDSDLVLGRDGDGLIYYDFPWDGVGAEASKDAQRNIPLIELDPDTEEPVPVSGAALDDKIAGTDNRPIAGGRFNEAAKSTQEGLDKLDSSLNHEMIIAARGLRSLGPWDCTGMTGTDCCLMIKNEVRDADINGNALQCFLDYKKGTELYDEQLTNRRVRIFANHLGLVSHVPRLG